MIRVFIVGVVAVFFIVRNNCSRTLVFSSSLIIVKSLQLRGCRQIAEPLNTVLCFWLFFFDVCFLYFFLFLTGWEFGLNSLHITLSHKHPKKPSLPNPKNYHTSSKTPKNRIQNKAWGPRKIPHFSSTRNLQQPFSTTTSSIPTGRPST